MWELNPAKRGHATANLGLQGIGLMRKEMPKKHESVIKNLSTDEMLRKACADDAEELGSSKEIDLGNFSTVEDYSKEIQNLWCCNWRRIKSFWKGAIKNW